MIIRAITIMLALTTLTVPADAGLWDNVASFFRKPVRGESPSIRVLVSLDQPTLQVDVDGPFKGYDPRTGENILVSKLGKKGIMRVIDGGIKWNEEFPGVHQIFLVPTSPATTISVNGVIYPGSIYFYDVENKLSAVNKVDMETYLASVLSPLHQENDAPEEYLAALAITARTNAYFLAENPSNPYWAVDAQKVGYHGKPMPSESEHIQQAISDTRYMVMSKTGAYEGIVTPFYGFWPKGKEAVKGKGVIANITLQEAEDMAYHGSNAAHILSKAFPSSTIQLTYHAPGTRR